jgi:methanogenic corrinoid protein MtbC1
VIAIAELRERYLRAQLTGNRREAVRLVVEDGLGRGAAIMELQEGVIQAAQDEIGRLWQQNQVTIAQEHMATAISHLTLAALFERAEPKPPLGKKLLLACVEGELHDLPARMAADFIDLEGFEVRYLGANVPHDSLVSMVRAEQPDVIGLSVTMAFNVPALRTAVERLRAAIDRPIFIGGHALRWQLGLAAQLGVEAGGDTATEVLATARRLAGL